MISSSFANRVLSVAVGLLLTSLVGSNLSAADKVPWTEDLAMAQQVAASRQQLVMVHFTADGCPPCQRLEKNVFSQATFAYNITTDFVPVKINASKSPELAERLGVTSWPTDIILTPNGQEIFRMISPQDPTEFAAKLRQAVWRFKANPDNPQVAMVQFPLKPPNTTAPINRPIMSPMQTVESLGPQPASYDGTGYNVTGSMLPPMENTSDSAQSTYSAQVQALKNASSAQPSRDIEWPAAQRAMALQNPQGATSQLATTNVAQASHNSDADAGSGNPTNPQFTPSNAYAGTQMITNSYANNANPAQTPAQIAAPPVNTVAQTAPPRASNFQPTTNPYVSSATPMNQPASSASEQVSFQHPAPSKPAIAQPAISVAMDGYCPVTLMDENDWVQGDKRWGARHRGRVFLFHSLAAQQKFLADPERYSPILVGYDPVAFATEGAYVQGKRAHGIRYQDQIVLFSSEPALEQFSRSPQQFMATVYQAMQPPQTMTR